MGFTKQFITGRHPFYSTSKLEPFVTLPGDMSGNSGNCKGILIWAEVFSY